MSKIVKIDIGKSTVSDTVLGDKVARFTYDDGGNTFIMANAFPSTEVMIRDCNDNPVVSGLLTMFKNADSHESRMAQSVQQWDHVWSDSGAVSRTLH